MPGSIIRTGAATGGRGEAWGYGSGERGTGCRAPRPSGEPRAVLPADRRQRLCRRHGRYGAKHRAGHCGARLPSGRPHRRPLLHRGLRCHQGADQLSGRSSVGPGRPEARPRDRMAGGRSRTFSAHVGTELGLGAGRQRPARRQSGADLVDDGHHEDRPGGTQAARPGDGTQ